MAEPRETTVVIPAFNEANGIAATIEGLKSQGFAEILVIDDGSTDGTAERALSLIHISEPTRPY